MSETIDPAWRSRRTRNRVGLSLLCCVAVLALVVTAFCWRVVLHPRAETMPGEPVDALLVLGPLEDWRVPLAEQYMREGRAKNLVLSTPTLPRDGRYCERTHAWPAYCFFPEPATTRGEAMGLKRLARQHGWTTFAVITVDYHWERSRFIFKRCLGQSVPVVGRRDDLGAGVIAHQTLWQAAGYAKEIWLGRCPE